VVGASVLGLLSGKIGENNVGTGLLIDLGSGGVMI